MPFEFMLAIVLDTVAFGPTADMICGCVLGNRANAFAILMQLPPYRNVVCCALVLVFSSGKLSTLNIISWYICPTINTFSGLCSPLINCVFNNIGLDIKEEEREEHFAIFIGFEIDFFFFLILEKGKAIPAQN